MFPQRFTRILLCLVLSVAFIPVVLSMVGSGERVERAGGVVEISISGGTVVPIVVAASFTRITDDNHKLVVNEREPSTRGNILATIGSNPGIHFRDICRQLKKEIGVVQYHVYILKRFGLVSSMRDGRFTRYFARDAGLDDASKLVVAAWQRPVEREILVALTAIGDAPVAIDTIATTCGVTTQAITWHLNRLKAAGLVSGWTSEIEPLAPGTRARIEGLLERGVITA